ncbi:hypothetical protein A3H10_03070 [Candidatus Uhrbacteria bacterium RIFCSPLOWO2_12_FULL_46_10]|uniref:Zn-dependent hydrolase n=1 Tax=Candidatus Uhrbacteria bacterium RIFCSPLOWO2_01_FULL_47_25 TaxID=1802402 RepID=A0A1F7UXQ7_9BACT|nr:MAG: Zn-dependent hydrolase of the beta-lactamase fold-like protein [Parcubacteria group bacterium GW2011_GWA2_46_9]OGL59741.1 MAG: hypothetical protein A2752_03065 [Candidatus Uhrbacteria bacterium RIFCSPHIGHO2_01_FULL_46_23]OGL70537.1 MAG: hypothetical protein A3D60_03635 [Candidatus Uhrbacteria bacterium RIFCSPHIGHO2_02_FULL_47_29]OGL75128.1 MAG: hypothetical protein A3E96_04275 [Candidatus Uhrbacteria bacterium RIFCSPHIGHO2_12_FULL_46_13]OGL83070.1 MAG: hypothetical protein A2936_05140 [
MTITWLGQNCFKIEGKQVSVLIDPIDGQELKMPKISADILVLPRPSLGKALSFLKNSPFIIQTPGEFEAKGVFVEGQVFGNRTQTIYRLEIEGVRLGHLGNLEKNDEAATSFLEDVDVLFVPVGGGAVLGPAEAAEVVSAIEPRLVIPMHYRQPGLVSLQPVEKFCQAMGVKSPERLPKVSVTKKDLPNEETRLVILEA